jgi:hypothetical protein
MTIQFEIPQDIEQELCGNGADLNGEAREAFLVELYRQDRITHHQLAEALGLSRLETEGVLKRQKVSSGVTAEEMRAQALFTRQVFMSPTMCSESPSSDSERGSLPRSKSSRTSDVI